MDPSIVCMVYAELLRAGAYTTHDDVRNIEKTPPLGPFRNEVVGQVLVLGCSQERISRPARTHHWLNAAKELKLIPQPMGDKFVNKCTAVALEMAASRHKMAIMSSMGLTPGLDELYTKKLLRGCLEIAAYSREAAAHIESTHRIGCIFVGKKNPYVPVYAPHGESLLSSDEQVLWFIHGQSPEQEPVRHGSCKASEILALADEIRAKCAEHEEDLVFICPSSIPEGEPVDTSVIDKPCVFTGRVNTKKARRTTR